MRKWGNLSVSMNDLNDNEFIKIQNEPHESRAFSRDIRINKLQERNVKLQRQVIKIERALSGMCQKNRYGIRLPEIKVDVIRKQLQNAYKMIKQYEYEITKRQKNDYELAFVQQVRKNEKILKEKQQVAQKIRKQAMEIKRQSLQYVKLLKDGNLKRQVQQKQSKINGDIKWLHEKIKRLEMKKDKVASHLQRQKDAIQKLEKQVAGKSQFDKTAVENIRAKIFNPTTHPTNEDDKISDDEIEPQQLRDQFALSDRNPDSYTSLIVEVKLYRKLEKDYSGKIELLTKQKEDAQQRNFKSRNKLLQIEYQIQKIEEAIAELKKQVNPKFLIPTKMDMINEEKRKQSQSVKINKPKLSMPHLFKFSQVGEATKAGKRFIDRNAIGKKPTKIIGVTFFEKQEGEHQLLGLQILYQVGSVKKKGSLNMLAESTLAVAKDFQLNEGDFVRTIDCFLNQKGIIVGVAMVSAGNVVLKGGAMAKNRVTIAMQPTDHPACLFGCLLPDGVQMLGAQYVSQQ